MYGVVDVEETRIVYGSGDRLVQPTARRGVNGCVCKHVDDMELSRTSVSLMSRQSEIPINVNSINHQLVMIQL